MAFIPAADTCQVELLQTYFGQKIENVLYWRLDGGFGAGEMVDLWNNLLIWWTTDFSTLLTGDLSLRGGKLTDLSSETGTSLDFNAPTPNPTGGESSPGLPGNVALTVSFRTALRGRAYRGRNFVAGMAESKVVGNTVSSDVIASLQAAYNGLKTLPFDNPWEWVQVSRTLNKVPRVTAAVTPISSATVVDPFIDSQRRRLAGRGQ